MTDIERFTGLGLGGVLLAFVGYSIWKLIRFWEAAAVSARADSKSDAHRLANAETYIVLLQAQLLGAGITPASRPPLIDHEGDT